MDRFPAWADNAEARTLLASIIASPPEYRITAGAWIEGGGRKVYRPWKRPDVAALNGMYRDWWEANYETAGAVPEQPDELIDRLLNPPIVEVETKELPDGRFRVAA